MIDLIIDGIPLSSFGLIMTYKNIGTINPRLTYIEVPGRDGAIDASDFTGVTYPNRKIVAQFALKSKDVFSDSRLFLESLNGRKVEATFTDEAQLTWNARVILSGYGSLDRGHQYSECEITLDAEPFPYDSLTGKEVRNVPNFG